MPAWFWISATIRAVRCVPPWLLQPPFFPDDTLVVSMDGPSIGADAKMFARANGTGLNTVKDSSGDILAFARTVPLVVLVDESSASAAEILAGALQDHGRAVLVGVRTYGKGSVQSVVSLGDGTALKLTVASYLTPSGRAIQGKGIEPDVRVEANPGDGQGDPADDDYLDHQLDEAMRILDASMLATRSGRPSHSARQGR